MSKQIRPLTALKKENPIAYQAIDELTQEEPNTSKKARENSWYWWYGSLMMEPYDEVLKRSTRRTDPFFFKENGYKANKGTVSEIGRLLLTGRYYNIEDWTQEICTYVYRSYHKKAERGDSFNDLEFKEAIKHIRDNIGYYYHNKEELKLYILETFFKDDIQPLLPEPPGVLKKHEKGTQLLEEIHKNRLKKDKNWYVKNYEILDEYCYYLSEILESYNIPYLSLEEFNAKQDKETEEYINEIQEAKEEYKTSLKNISITKYLGDK